MGIVFFSISISMLPSPHNKQDRNKQIPKIGRWIFTTCTVQLQVLTVVNRCILLPVWISYFLYCLFLAADSEYKNVLIKVVPLVPVYLESEGNCAYSLRVSPGHVYSSRWVGAFAYVMCSILIYWKPVKFKQWHHLEFLQSHIYKNGAEIKQVM